MGPKAGSKLTDTPKDFLLRVRIDEETRVDLDQCAEALHSDRSKVVRKGIQLVKQALQKKDP